MESQADLEARISQCNQQMVQVNELLQIDPQNAQFLKLKEDLVNLTELTKALLVKAIEGGSSAAVSSAAPVAPSLGSAVAQSGPKPVPVKTGAIGVGEVVEVTGGDRLFAGVVTEIISPSEYKIKYFEYPAEVSLPVTSLQRLPLSFYSPDKVQVGLVCQCKYAADQNYYDCKVTALTPSGCMVTYTQYGNSEEVPLAYLKPITSSVKPTGKMAGKHAPTAGGLIPIPDSLQILPTDTEKEIEKKKKEIKSIKNKNRLITQETEMKEAQNSWKKFVTKGTKRPDSGIVKNSLFSSTEEVTGKVGVVNSGKKMTEFVARKKHKFDNI